MRNNVLNQKGEGEKLMIVVKGLPLGGCRRRLWTVCLRNVGWLQTHAAHSS